MMKTIVKFIMLFFVMYVLLSCSKKEDNPMQSIDDTFLTCEIDGKKFKNSFPVVKTTTKYVIDGYESTTTAISSEDNQAGYIITLSRIVEVNSIEETTRESYVIGCGKGNDLWTESIIEGKITTAIVTITNENDTYIEGTFSFVGVHVNPEDKSTRTVTNGRFKAKKII